MSNDLWYIGDRVFYNCSALVNITVSNSIMEIGEEAFFNC